MNGFSDGVSRDARKHNYCVQMGEDLPNKLKTEKQSVALKSRGSCLTEKFNEFLQMRKLGDIWGGG